MLPRVFVVVTGNVTIDGGDAEDTAALDCLSGVEGNVIVTRASPKELQLACLESVGGDLLFSTDDTMDGEGQSSIQLPALESVGGLLSIDSLGELAELDLPSLESVGAFELQEDASVGKMETLTLPSLREVAGHFYINYKIQSLALLLTKKRAVLQ